MNWNKIGKYYVAVMHNAAQAVVELISDDRGTEYSYWLATMHNGHSGAFDTLATAKIYVCNELKITITE